MGQGDTYFFAACHRDVLCLKKRLDAEILPRHACYAVTLQHWEDKFVETLQIDEPLNVFGETLLPCSEDPLTGFPARWLLQHQ